MIGHPQSEVRPQPGPVKLDHLVINAMFELDLAQSVFEALGFVVTPRGYHSLGSMNHLMVVGDAYLELVGVPRQGLQRQDVLDSPLGLSGLVFQSADADATHARLSAAGLPALEPLQFFRPLELDGVEHPVGFRIVRMGRDRFAAGRVYFCQHLTPEMVWRQDWLKHPNGLRAIASVTVESPDAAADAALYGAVAEASPSPRGDGFVLELDNASVEFIPAAQSRFASATLMFDRLDAIESAALTLEGVQWTRHDACRATLVLPALHLSLCCLGLRDGNPA